MSATIIQFPTARAAHRLQPTSEAPAQRTHRCHADDCKVDIPRHQPFCETHTAMLSQSVQRAVWREYRHAGDDLGQFISGISAIENACDAIRRAERRLLPKRANA
jgi:hypothetical protein